MTLEKAIRDYMPEMLIKLDKFKDTGYSFEEWINWELLHAISKSGMNVSPKPSYKPRTNGRETGLGDLFVQDKYFIEVASVHDATGDKWISKIDGDRRALETLTDHCIQPIQILLLVSKHQELEIHENWKPWLKEISFWSEEASWSISESLPSGGQVVVKCWAIST